MLTYDYIAEMQEQVEKVEAEAKAKGDDELALAARNFLCALDDAINEV